MTLKIIGTGLSRTGTMSTRIALEQLGFGPCHHMMELFANPRQVEQYREGKPKLLGFFVGQVMKATRGKANPKLVNEILKDRLETD